MYLPLRFWQYLWLYTRSCCPCIGVWKDNIHHFFNLHYYIMWTWKGEILICSLQLFELQCSLQTSDIFEGTAWYKIHFCTIIFTTILCPVTFFQLPRNEKCPSSTSCDVTTSTAISARASSSSTVHNLNIIAFSFTLTSPKLEKRRK